LMALSLHRMGLERVLRSDMVNTTCGKITGAFDANVEARGRLAHGTYYAYKTMQAPPISGNQNRRKGRIIMARYVPAWRWRTFLVPAHNALPLTVSDTETKAPTPYVDLNTVTMIQTVLKSENTPPNPVSWPVSKPVSRRGNNPHFWSRRASSPGDQPERVQKPRPPAPFAQSKD